MQRTGGGCPVDWLNRWMVGWRECGSLRALVLIYPTIQLSNDSTRSRVTATRASAPQELAIQPSAIGFGFPGRFPENVVPTANRPYPWYSLSTGQLVERSTNFHLKTLPIIILHKINALCLKIDKTAPFDRPGAPAGWGQPPDHPFP